MHRTDVFGFRGRPGWRDRFKRHAAFRTRPRMVLPNLGMHRARIKRSARHNWQGSTAFRRCRFRQGESYKAVRIVFESLETAQPAEMVRRALVLKRSGTLRRVDLHPAHRVDDFATQCLSKWLRAGLAIKPLVVLPISRCRVAPR